MIFYELDASGKLVSPKYAHEGQFYPLGSLKGLGSLFSYKNNLYFQPENVRPGFTKIAARVNIDVTRRELFVGLFDQSEKALETKFSREHHIGLAVNCKDRRWIFVPSSDLFYEGGLPNFGTFYTSEKRLIFVPFGSTAQSPESGDYAIEIDEEWLEYHGLSLAIVRANK